MKELILNEPNLIIAIDARPWFSTNILMKGSEKPPELQEG